VLHLAERELLRVAMIEGQDENNEELVACLKYALGLEGGTDFSEGADNTAPQGMVREVFIELCELIVPKWDRKNV
jgi:hypothetical protein